MGNISVCLIAWLFVASESDDDDHLVTSAAETAENVERTVECLPNELLLNIFNRLSVRDICRCAQVCRLWNQQTKQKMLWTDVLPTQWAQGEVFLTQITLPTFSVTWLPDASSSHFFQSNSRLGWVLQRWTFWNCRSRTLSRIPLLLPNESHQNTIKMIKMKLFFSEFCITVSWSNQFCWI